MSYETTRAAVFEAATSCRLKGQTVLIAGKLLRREDIKRAFAEWKEISGDAAILTFAKSANGEMIVELTPKG